MEERGLSSPGGGRSPLVVVLLLFLVSGATSLVYEVLWLRQLILIFGSTQFATSTILSTFMGGLALGAFVAGRWLGSRAARPLRIYGLLEIGIGAYALAVPLFFSWLTPIYRVLWEAGLSENFMLLSLAKFVGIGFVLLPPTVLMGASLPVLAREVADDPERIGGKVGRLYAINTFGAVLGVFLAGFVAIPNIGMQRTLWITAAGNLLVGLVALSFAREVGTPARTSDASAATAHETRPRLALRVALVVFALSGCGALILEVAWTRVLTLVMGSSVYAFSLMLVAFLIGLAAGSAFFSGLLRRRPGIDPGRLLALLLGSAGAMAYATTFLFGLLPPLFGRIFFTFAPGPNGWLAIQLLFGLMVMFPATFALGGIFPAMLQIHARGLDRVAGSVGTVYAANTVGTIVGAAAAGFLLIPRLGVQPTVISVAVLELCLGLVVLAFVCSRGARVRVALAVPLALVALTMLWVRPVWDVRLMNSGVYMNLWDRDSSSSGWEDFLDVVNENNDVVYAAEGLTASVFVGDQPEYDNRYLAVNGKVEASTTTDLQTQLMCAHLPLLFHSDPSDVLVIGLASGITVGAVATHPVDSIRVVEVEKAMVPAARLFADYNDHVLDDPRLELSINDARNELEFSPRTYDVIISEPSNPWMTVAANLFTEDFFRMARTRVRPGGIFSQWIQNYYLAADDLGSIIAAFQASFPNVMIFQTLGGVDLLMVGSEQRLHFDLEDLEERMSELKVRMDLTRAAVRTPVDILGLFRLGPDEVRRLVAEAPRNTDDNARVEFSAPKSLGLQTIDPNLKMLRRFRGDPLEQIAPPIEDPQERDRLRLRLAEIWLYRGDYTLAAESARKVSAGPESERAGEIIEKAESALSRL